MMIDCVATFGRNRVPFLLAAAAVGAALVAAPAHKAAAVEMSPAAKAVVDYDKSGAKPGKKYRIAYLTECVDNPYCLARLARLKAAAAKYGFEFKIFDANFSPATQAKVVENAVTEGFDGYLFGPQPQRSGHGRHSGLVRSGRGRRACGSHSGDGARQTDRHPRRS
jgi:ABC-type sugar transport system substrate-binding protein